MYPLSRASPQTTILYMLIHQDTKNWGESVNINTRVPIVLLQLKHLHKQYMLCIYITLFQLSTYLMWLNMLV